MAKKDKKNKVDRAEKTDEMLEIKKIRFTCDEWETIIDKRYRQRKLNLGHFKGKLAKIQIREVSKPQFWNYGNQKLKVCDAGMTWLIIAPDEAFYSIMMVLDETGEPIAWYIDIIGGTGADEDGVFYYEDMFLDEVVLSDGQVVEDDLQELKDACTRKVITKEQFDRTIQVSEGLKQWLSRDFTGFKKSCLSLKVWI